MEDVTEKELKNEYKLISLREYRYLRFWRRRGGGCFIYWLLKLGFYYPV